MPKYGPRPSDLTYTDATELLHPHVRGGVGVLLKWTCPTCGERVTGDAFMQLHPQTGQLIWHKGYAHTEKDDGTPCGTVVDTFTYRFGCMLIMSSHGPVTPPPDFMRTAKGN